MNGRQYQKRRGGSTVQEDLGPDGTIANNPNPVATCLWNLRNDSGQDLFHDFSMNIRQPVITALEFVGETGMVNSQAMQHRGM